MKNSDNENIQNNNSKIIKIIFISIIAFIILGIIIVSIIAVNYKDDIKVQNYDSTNTSNQVSNNNSNDDLDINGGLDKLKEAFPNTTFTAITPENSPEVDAKDNSTIYSWTVTDGAKQFILKEAVHKSDNKDLKSTYYSTNYPYVLYNEQAIKQLNNDLATLNKDYTSKFVLHESSLIAVETLGHELNNNNSFDKYYFYGFLHHHNFIRIIVKNTDLDTLNNDLKLLRYKEKFSALYPSDYYLKQGIDCEAFSLNEDEYNNFLSTDNSNDIPYKNAIGKAILIEGDK